MTKRVLVVDDEAEFRSLVCEALRMEGYETSEAADGVEAVQAFRAAAPDAVLLDLQMPRKTGLPTLREMRAHRSPEVPVVILSGRGDIATAVEAVKAGAFDYIEKPPDFERVSLSLRQALEQAAAGRRGAAHQRGARHLPRGRGSGPAPRSAR